MTASIASSLSYGTAQCADMKLEEVTLASRLDRLSPLTSETFDVSAET